MTALALALLATALHQPATIARAIDGDTLVTTTGIHVRLLGIDCPESHRNRKCQRSKSCAEEIPAGLRAAARARELAEGARVVLEVEGRRRLDVYGRTLAYVRLSDGRDLGLVLLAEGLCADYSARYPHPRAAAYRQATP